MQLIDSINQRRSYREFESTPVERSKLEQLMAVAQKAPVSCNLQLSQFVIIDDQDTLRYLGQHVSSKFIYAPTVIVALIDNRFTVERSSAVTALGMAVENMLLLATELGIGACAMAGFQQDDIIKKKLNIPSAVDIVLIIAIGYPKKDVYKSTIAKINLDQTFSYNSYGSLPRLNGSAVLTDHTPASIREYRSRIGSVYLDRLRLNTWSDSFYQQAAEIFQVMTERAVTSDTIVLDVMTYDGKFISYGLKQLKNRVIASDYVPHHLEIYRELFGCQTVAIDNNNKLPDLADHSIDIVTFVYQSSFTPQLEKLLDEIRRVVKPQGFIFLVHGQEHWWKYYSRRCKQWIRALVSRYPVNIYEGNPYFRLGPYQHMTLRTLRQKLKKASFNIRQSQVSVQKGLISSYLLCDVESGEVGVEKSRG